ncbi:MAG TPA: hypothetical protein VGE59_02670 [Patescibacteria group bacterium]
MLTSCAVALLEGDWEKLLTYYQKVWPYQSVQSAYIYQLQGVVFDGPGKGSRFHHFLDISGGGVCLGYYPGGLEAAIGTFCPDNVPYLDRKVLEFLRGLETLDPHRGVERYELTIQEVLLPSRVTVGGLLHCLEAYDRTLQELDQVRSRPEWPTDERLICEEVEGLFRSVGRFCSDQSIILAEVVTDWLFED